MHFTSHNEQETIDIAQNIVKNINKNSIICLYGDLGAGKSLICREIIRFLCNNPELEVPSPTFTLVQTYDCATMPIWHFDLYRLEHPEEIYEIGWEEALQGGLTLIEWPQRLGTLLPQSRIDITIKTEHNKRLIHMDNKQS